jgi:hypothetical protein
MWIVVGTNDSLLWTRYDISGSVKGGDFLVSRTGVSFSSTIKIIKISDSGC